MLATRVSDRPSQVAGQSGSKREAVKITPRIGSESNPSRVHSPDQLKPMRCRLTRSTGFNRRDGERRRVALAAREGVVGKGDIGADEHVVLDSQAVPELHAGFDRGAVADDHVVLDEDVGADVAVGADAGVGENDDELPDFSIRPNTRRLHFRKSVE
jgi:hypothetical protein